ncbi:MAG: DUF3015 family protein [Deltaproteobacteria bacterium]|nr:DUF3015 family protein [Deltaproteobacteria bacterium]
MKSFILVLALMSITLVASAEDKSDGCGLGWQVTNKTSFLATTTRSTTNAFVPPTFGMTSGTIGCAQHSFAKKDLPAVHYVASNYEPLMIQMAEGRGEYVDGLAKSMGCGDGVADAFGRMTQSKYRTLLQGGKASAIELFNRVKQEVRSDAVLAVGCNA